MLRQIQPVIQIQCGFRIYGVWFSTPCAISTMFFFGMAGPSMNQTSVRYLPMSHLLRKSVRWVSEPHRRPKRTLTARGHSSNPCHVPTLTRPGRFINSASGYIPMVVMLDRASGHTGYGDGRLGGCSFKPDRLSVVSPVLRCVRFDEDALNFSGRHDI